MPNTNKLLEIVELTNISKSKIQQYIAEQRKHREFICKQQEQLTSLKPNPAIRGSRWILEPLESTKELLKKERAYKELIRLINMAQNFPTPFASEICSHYRNLINRLLVICPFKYQEIFSIIRGLQSTINFLDITKIAANNPQQQSLLRQKIIAKITSLKVGLMQQQYRRTILLQYQQTVMPSKLPAYITVGQFHDLPLRTRNLFMNNPNLAVKLFRSPEGILLSIKYSNNKDEFLRCIAKKIEEQSNISLNPHNSLNII